MYVYGDFGHAAMAGTWYIFFSEVVLQMARAMGVLMCRSQSMWMTCAWWHLRRLKRMPR
jgi:hypothetical protein